MCRTMKFLTLYAVLPLLSSTLATRTLPYLDPGIVDRAGVSAQTSSSPASAAVRPPVFTRLGAPPKWEARTSSEGYAGRNQPYLTR